MPAARFALACQDRHLAFIEFTTEGLGREGLGRDPVAETQRTAGVILGYMTRMGVSSSIMEVMSSTDDIRWLTPQQASDMKLVTDPLAQR